MLLEKTNAAGSAEWKRVDESRMLHETLLWRSGVERPPSSSWFLWLMLMLFSMMRGQERRSLLCDEGCRRLSLPEREFFFDRTKIKKTISEEGLSQNINRTSEQCHFKLGAIVQFPWVESSLLLMPGRWLLARVIGILWAASGSLLKMTENPRSHDRRSKADGQQQRTRSLILQKSLQYCRATNLHISSCSNRRRE